MITTILMLVVPLVFVVRVLVLCHRHKVNAAKANLKYQLENKEVA